MATVSAGSAAKGVSNVLLGGLQYWTLHNIIAFVKRSFKYGFTDDRNLSVGSLVIISDKIIAGEEKGGRERKSKTITSLLVSFAAVFIIVTQRCFQKGQVCFCRVTQSSNRVTSVCDITKVTHRFCPLSISSRFGEQDFVGPLLDSFKSSNLQCLSCTLHCYQSVLHIPGDRVGYKRCANCKCFFFLVELFCLCSRTYHAA